MTEYDNTNSGALFKNKRKEHDRQPDMRGQVNVEGTEYWVSAWRKMSRKGEPFISMALTPKDEQARPAQQDDTVNDPTDLGSGSDSDYQRGAQKAQQMMEEAPKDFDDDIPF